MLEDQTPFTWKSRTEGWDRKSLTLVSGPAQKAHTRRGLALNPLKKLMCTIDPSMCWYYDHWLFWAKNPELLERESEWHKVEDETAIAKYKYIREQIASGRIKAHRIKEADGGNLYYECCAAGYCSASGPIEENRVCHSCKKSIDE